MELIPKYQTAWQPILYWHPADTEDEMSYTLNPNKVDIGAIIDKYYEDLENREPSALDRIGLVFNYMVNPAYIASDFILTQDWAPEWLKLAAPIAATLAGGGINGAPKKGRPTIYKGRQATTYNPASFRNKKTTKMDEFMLEENGYGKDGNAKGFKSREAKAKQNHWDNVEAERRAGQQSEVSAEDLNLRTAKLWKLIKLQLEETLLAAQENRLRIISEQETPKAKMGRNTWYKILRGGSRSEELRNLHENYSIGELPKVYKNGELTNAAARRLFMTDIRGWYRLANYQSNALRNQLKLTDPNHSSWIRRRISEVDFQRKLLDLLLKQAGYNPRSFLF